MLTSTFGSCRQDLYFKYTYNNFLHAQVEACLTNVFSSHAGDETIENHSKPLPENPVIQHVSYMCVVPCSHMGEVGQERRNRSLLAFGQVILMWRLRGREEVKGGSKK